MQEFNKHTLDAALAKLRVHLPDEDVWENIEETLELDDAIENKIPSLHQYSPPEMVWDNIEEELEKESKPTKLRWLRPALAAASVALIFFIFTLGNSTSLTANKVTEEYSVEQFPRQMFQRKNYNNQYASAAIQALVKAQKISKDENHEILSELEELELAAQKLNKAMGLYDTDYDLKSKLESIEGERSELMDELLAEIKI